MVYVKVFNQSMQIGNVPVLQETFVGDLDNYGVFRLIHNVQFKAVFRRFKRTCFAGMVLCACGA